MPAGKTVFNSKTLSSSSKAYLLRLPLGVSMMTRTTLLSLGSSGFRRDTSARPLRVPFLVMARWASPTLDCWWREGGEGIGGSPGTGARSSVEHRSLERLRQSQDRGYLRAAA